MEERSGDVRGTVARVIDLLGCIADAGAPLALSRIAGSAELPRSTTHRLLQLLRSEGFVVVDPVSRAYSAGPGFHRVAALLRGQRPVSAVALPVMRELVDRCDEDALLSLYVPQRLAMLFAEWVESTTPLRAPLDLNVPQSLLWGPSGRAILACLDDAEVERVIAAEGEELSPGGVRLDRDELHAHLAKVREEGVFAARGSRLPSVIGIASPFFFADGSVAGSVALVIPEARFPSGDRSQLTALTRDGARRVSSLLGHAAR